MKSRRLRRLVAGSVLLAFGFFLALLLAELFLRVFPNFLPSERRDYLAGDSGGVADSYIGHLQRPNNEGILVSADFRARHRTDSHGFRNQNPWPDRADIVVLGDSLAFGYGVGDDASWPALLDHAFPDLKLMNLGLIGAGPEQYRRVYRVYARPLHPRLVVVGMFTGNDFWDARMFDAWLHLGRKGNYLTWRDYGRSSRGPWGALKNSLVVHSYLYNLVAAAKERYRIHDEGGPSPLKLGDGSTMQLLPGEHDRLTQGSVQGRPEFDLVVQSLTRLKESTERENSRLLLVLQPSKEEVYGPLLGLAVRDSTAALRPELDRLQIPYLNLIPAFRERAEKGEKLFFEHDGHPNSAGYKLIADCVMRFLNENKAIFPLAPGRTVYHSRRSGKQVTGSESSPVLFLGTGAVGTAGARKG